MPQFDLIDSLPPLSAEKNLVLSLSHLVPEILEPKHGLMFHPNVLFNSFKKFASIFPLVFDPVDHVFISF